MSRKNSSRCLGMGWPSLPSTWVWRSPRRQLSIFDSVPDDSAALRRVWGTNLFSFGSEGLETLGSSLIKASFHSLSFSSNSLSHCFYFSAISSSLAFLSASCLCFLSSYATHLSINSHYLIILDRKQLKT